MTSSTLEQASLSSFAAAEIRAELGRQGLTQAELGARIGKNGRWVSVRISRTASVDMTVDEIAEITEALGVDTEGLMVAALRTWYTPSDSNREPADYEQGGLAVVNVALTPISTVQSRWELAA